MSSYKVYFSNAGLPSNISSSAISWNTLKKIDGTNYTPQPTFSAIDQTGWFLINITSFSADVCGVIDGSSALSNSDRYVPFDASPNDIYLDQSVSAQPSEIWSFGNRSLTNAVQVSGINQGVQVEASATVDTSAIANNIMETVIDEKTFQQAMEIMLAMATGRITRNNNKFTYYKQDNATELFTLESEKSERTRI